MRRVITVVCFVVLLTPVVPASAVPVTITAPTDGATIGGLITVTADAPGATAVTFERSLGGGPWVHIATDADGADGWSARWDSAPHDGPLALRAIADGDEATVAVTLANAPTLGARVAPRWFSPNRDGRLDRTTITARVDEAVRLAVRIVDAAGRTRRRWEPTDVGAGTFRLRWTGRTAAGRVLPDGRYTVQIRVTDSAGHPAVARRAVVIDTRAPAVRVALRSADPAGGSTVRRTAIRIADEDRRFRATLRVAGPTGGVGRTHRFSIRGRTAERGWHPRHTLTPGTYRTLVTARDRAGNVGRARPEAWRVHRSMHGRIIRRFEDVGRRVALTFDDCHFASAWDSILATLRRRGVRASFFCGGQMLAAHPNQARRTIAHGHTPGSHGWDHADLTHLSDAAIRERFRRDLGAWWRYGGETAAPYMRPPYGAVNDRVVRIAGEESMPRVMMWDVDLADWRRPGTSALLAGIRHQVRPGSVIVLHTIPETAAALGSILDTLASMRLRPVSLDQIVAARR